MPSRILRSAPLLCRNAAASPRAIFSPTLHSSQRGYAGSAASAAFSSAFPRTSSSLTSDPETLFAQQFGAAPSNTTAAARLRSANAADQVEALFSRQFDANAAHANAARFTKSHSSSGSSSGAGGSQTQGLDPRSQLPGDSLSVSAARAAPAASGPWSGLWAALRGPERAALSSSSPHNRAWRTSSPATHPAAAPPSLNAAAAAHHHHHYQQHQHQQYTQQQSASTAGAEAPSAATQRYWYSYRLWQAVHQRVQQEGGVLEGIRSEANRMKEAQRANFQTQLRGTTRWTLFVVLPLLTALWVTVFFDSVLYRSEVLRLRFVNYDAVLKEFEAAASKDQAAKAWRSHNGGKPKKGEVRID